MKAQQFVEWARRVQRLLVRCLALLTRALLSGSPTPLPLRTIIVFANRRCQLVRFRGVRTRMLLCVRRDRHSLPHETTKLKSIPLLGSLSHAFMRVIRLNKDCEE